MPKLPLVALDTNVLLDLAKADEKVIDCIETIRARVKNAHFVVLPTVVQELMGIADDHERDESELAIVALSSILEWGFQPVNCIPVGNGIVEETGRKLRNAGLIPDDQIHDSFIVAEAALADATMLVSNDAHIRDINPTQLKIELDRCDLGCPLIASPRKIVRDFFRK